MENIKKCSKCGLTKPIINFSLRKSNIYHSICKTCLNEYAKEYRNKNKNQIKIKQQYWYNTKGKVWKKNYENINKDIINKKVRIRYKNDPNFRIKKIIRSRFKKTVLGKKKYSKILDYIGINLEYFLIWIEFNFDENMNWENQGTYWDIDHIKPCSSFNLLDENNLKLCFNWTNLRPCEKTENNKKSNSINKKIIEHYNNRVNLFITKYPVPS